MSHITTLDSTLWLSSPVTLDPTTPFLHHIPVLKSLAARINTLWTQCQSQAHRNIENNPNQQQIDEHSTQDLLAVSMILALRFCRVVLLQLPTHPRYQKRIHAAVLRPLVQEASKFMVRVEQYKADGGLSYLSASQGPAGSVEEPCETELLPAVSPSNLTPVETNVGLEVEPIHQPDTTNTNTERQSQKASLAPLPTVTASPSSVIPGRAPTAHRNIATQIGILPHSISIPPSETQKEESPSQSPSTPLSKNIDNQATLEKDIMLSLASLGFSSTHSDLQGGSSASTPNKDVSLPKTLSIADTPEPQTSFNPSSLSTMSSTPIRPFHLRGAFERQKSIRREFEASQTLITSSTAIIESSIREANRQLERIRRPSGSTKTSPSPASSPSPTSVRSISNDLDDLSRRIAEREHRIAMQVERDIAREMVMAGRSGVWPKARNESYVEQHAPLGSIGYTPRVSTETVDTIVRRSYSAATAARLSVPKNEPARSASTTTMTTRHKMNFAESASASSVRSKISLYNSTPPTPAPSWPKMSKTPIRSEVSLLTPAKPTPKVGRPCREPVSAPDTVPIRKSPSEHKATGNAASSSSSSSSSTGSTRHLTRQSSKYNVLSRISHFEQMNPDPPRRSYSASTPPSVRPHPVSFYASLGSMPNISTFTTPRFTTAPIPVSSMSRPLPTPPVRARADHQKRHSSYLDDSFRTLDNVKGDTDSMMSDNIYEDDGLETVELERIPTQSSVASSSQYLRQRRQSMVVPSTMERREVPHKVSKDEDQGNESDGSLQYLDVPEQVDPEEWIKNNRASSMPEFSTTSSIKSVTEASEDEDEANGNRSVRDPPKRNSNVLSTRSMASGSTSSIRGGHEDVMTLAPPSPAFRTFASTESRAPVTGTDYHIVTGYKRAIGSMSKTPWFTPTTARAPTSRGFSKLNSHASLLSTSTRSLQRFDDEEGEEEKRARDGALASLYMPMSPASIRARHTSDTVRSSSTASLNVKDAEDLLVRRHRR
ncbi:hypothetical protein CPC16_010037 [Podila verticillata]|nr:hypothetical protein CPC16_010037 [Podila verticillata]